MPPIIANTDVKAEESDIFVPIVLAPAVSSTDAELNEVASPSLSSLEAPSTDAASETRVSSPVASGSDSKPADTSKVLREHNSMIGPKRAVHDPEKLVCCTELKSLLGSEYWDCETPESLETFSTTFKTSIAAAAALRAATKVASNALKKFIDGVKKEADKKKTKDAKEQETSARAAAKKKAKEAANRVESQEKDVRPVFKLDWESLAKGMKLVVNVSSLDANTYKFNTEFPFIGTTAADIEKWQATAEVQLALSTWAGSYAKDPEVKQSGRGQKAMQAKQGLAPTNVLFVKLSNKGTGSQVSAESLPNGGAIVRNSWLFGYASSMCDASFTPYGLGMIKVVCAGSIHVVCCRAKAFLNSLQEFQAPEEVEGMNQDKFLSLFLDMDIKALTWYGAKCEFRHGVVRGGEFLYIPMGWILCEYAEGPLVYGVRRSVVPSASAAELRNLIDVYKHLSKSCDKLEQVAVAIEKG